MTAAPAPKDSWAGLRVLLVEDDAVNRILSGLVVASVTGVEPDVACDGEEACTLARQTAYDLILMDLQLPGIDGLQAVSQIRLGAGPTGRAAIVALTASTWAADAERCRAAGLDGLLAKPLVAAELRALRLPASPGAAPR
jgi:CheY-like chemotaxis protein